MNSSKEPNRFIDATNICGNIYKNQVQPYAATFTRHTTQLRSLCTHSCAAAAFARHTTRLRGLYTHCCAALADASLTASTPAAASPAVTAATPTHSATATPAAASTLFESSAQHSDLINENVALKKQLMSSTQNYKRTLEIDVQSLKQKHTLPVPSHSLTLKNRYEALETLNDQNTTGFTTVTSKKKNKGTKNSMKTLNSLKKYLYDKNKRKTAHTKTSVPFRNVTVIGDSHVRNLSAILRRRTSATNIVGVCKPGAGLLQIKPTTPPPEDHCFVLIVGTNDLAAGRQDIIYQHMEEIIQQYSGNSKVLVSPLLPRHDLPRDSPVHKKVALANNYISELCERYKGAAFLDISDLSRHHFTAHGLHLTTAGKAILADLIVKGLNSPPRTFNRTPAESAPRPPLSPPTPPPPPTSAQGHNTYAEAVTQRPAGASTLPTTKTFYGVHKSNTVFRDPGHQRRTKLTNEINQQQKRSKFQNHDSIRLLGQMSPIHNTFV
ncbi:hypothetical protein J6590_070095 [Homalodisca vitripennis]|nr:hypothetical protein J6590_070095 [Homalodisca vitripennis]